MFQFMKHVFAIGQAWLGDPDKKRLLDSGQVTLQGARVSGR